MLELNLADPATAAGIPLDLLRDKNQDFEAKIAGLLRSAYARASDNPHEQQNIEQAVQKLTGSTHYIVVPASTALQPQPGGIGPDILRSVPVISLASGRIVAIHAKLGDTVHKGQLLLQVQSSDVAGAFSDYRKAV
ncbi:MAG: efflux RND transporter periplasmic adaptor subunit, partial [Acidobacteriia bacterium]|nr:efflux RND transporter periplasmic adaptor subunit [Terriglobia bacterium]